MPKNIKEDHEAFRKVVQNPNIAFELQKKIRDGSIFHGRKPKVVKPHYKMCNYCGASNASENASCYMCQSDFESKHKAIKCQVEIYEE